MKIFPVQKTAPKPRARNGPPWLEGGAIHSLKSMCPKIKTEDSLPPTDFQILGSEGEIETYIRTRSVPDFVSVEMNKRESIFCLQHNDWQGEEIIITRDSICIVKS
jgi:hypothetical protein